MSAEAPPRPQDLNYGLDDVPKPFSKAVVLGLQHVLTAFGATVAVPLIMAPALGFSAPEIAVLISSVFICSAIATALQVTIGSRLPIVQGVSFAFLGPFFAITAAHTGAEAMRYIAGAILLGAVVEIVIGFGGVIGFLRRFISPITIGPVIAMIGLGLYGAAADNSAGNWWLALGTVALVFVFSLVLAPRVRMFSLFPILLAVVAVYVVAWVLTVAGVLPEDPALGGVTFAGIGEAAWFRGFEVGGGGFVLPWGTPLFSLGFFIAVLAAYIASMIESFGDYHAISRIATGGDPTAKQINRGIGSEGLGCFFTGLLGGFASTSYSENIGLVGLTKVASRYVVLVGAGALFVLGLIGKIGAVIATIPTPIVGGVYLSLFGLIAAVGLSNLRRADMDSQRNLMIVGFVLFMSLVLPTYFGGLPPEWNLWGIDWLSNIVRSIGGSAISVAAVLGLVLDNLIPGTERERGLDAYDVVFPPEDVPGKQEA